MPKYSFIVVNYNGEKYIDDCITNLLGQEYKDYEIIFINDGSTDNTEKVLLKYSNKIRYYNETHKGVSAARNYGISISKGQYFLFVDVDDYVEKDLLLKLENYTKTNIDLLKYGCKLVDESKQQIGEYKGININKTNGQEAFKTLSESKIIFDVICMYLYNKSFWDSNHFAFSPGHYHEDFGLIPYLILKSKKFISIDYLGYIYVQTNNSITRNNDYEKEVKKANDYLYHYDNLYKLVNNDEFNEDTIKYFNSYISNAVINKVKKLHSFDRKGYINQLNKRNVTNNLLSNSLKRKIKKIIVKLYLKVIK